MVSKDEHGGAKLALSDRDSVNHPMPIDLPMNAFFPPGRRRERNVETVTRTLKAFDAATSLKERHGVSSLSDMISQATKLVFSLPAVGSKMFLITIGDRVSSL